MERFSDLLKSAKGAMGSALEKSQVGVITASISAVLPKAIETSFSNLDPALQMELAGALKEIVDSFHGDNAKLLNWQKLMKNPGTQALLSDVVKQMVKGILPKI